MVAYSFQERFVDPIRRGSKQQTIRAPRHGRGRHVVPGQEIQAYCGMRTRSCFLIGRYRCIGVSAILMTFNADRRADRVLVLEAPALPLDAFARCDGFADWADLRAFWQVEHPDLPRLVPTDPCSPSQFEGMIIFWEPL
jgi:hypothetical protein